MTLCLSDRNLPSNFGEGTPDYRDVEKCILRELCALALVESTRQYLC